MSDSHPSVSVAVLTRLFDRPVENQETRARAPLVPNWARLWAGLSNAGRRLLAAVGERAEMGSLVGAGNARKTGQ